MNVLSGAAAAPVMSERRVSILGAMLVVIGPVSMALFTPAMPEIVRAFATTEAAVKMTLSLYFAGFAFAQLFCGPLSDGFGRKPVTIAFMAIYLGASFMALLAPTIETLIAARFLQGVGAAAGVAIARAIVRDLFTHEQSARIMNLIGIILAAGPALAPTVGGLTMEVAGWHAIFALMAVGGMAIVLAVHLWLKETVVRDISRIQPRALATSYAMLIKSRYFIAASLTIAGTVGALYTQATVLPFILMGRLGLSPSAFGVGMLAQSGSFFAGALLVRVLMRRISAYNLVPYGLSFVALGSLLIAALPAVVAPSYLSIMAPVGLYAFGISFVMPAMMTAAMAPFPHIAGAASSLSGFFQMGSGLLGGAVAALIGDPILAMTTIIPCMGATAVVSFLVWRRLPEPALASAVRVVPEGPA